LERDCESKAHGFQGHPAYCDFEYEPKASIGKDAEVEEKDREFRKALNEAIKYARDVVKLSIVSFTWQMRDAPSWYLSQYH